MASSDAPILDQWAPLRHKGVMQSTGLGRVGLAPSWVPDEDAVRLTAYKILKALELNSGRGFLPSGTPDAARDAMREYGDAALFANAVRAGVLGDGPEIVVEGADVDLPDAPDLPPAPEAPKAPESGEDPEYAVRKRIYDSQFERWTADADEAVEEWERLWTDLPGLQERQRWLRDWATTEGFWRKLHEAEGDAVTLGDGVLTLAWSAAKQRPVLRVYDPGFYFPVLDERAADEGFPRKVHIAWEFERTVDRQTKRYLRRLTWELADRAEAVTYPWGTEPSTQTCLFSDGTWDLSDVRGDNGLADLGPAGVVWATTEDGAEANGLDLGIDFIPVIHIPNTPASREHFGSSVLLPLAQLLDDIHAVDTDVQKASRLAAGPAIGLSGKKTVTDSKLHVVGPGVVYELGEGGRMDVLDLSAGLTVSMSLAAAMRDLMSVNGRVPGAALGRIEPGQAPSGVALAMIFSPFGQLIGELRLPREDVHSLLLRFSQRLAMAGGILEAGPVPKALVAYGPFLPTDRAAIVEQVARLLGAGGISRQNAVQTLVAAGWTIDDAKAEVDRIRQDRPAEAKEIADATGSEELAAEALGLTLPEGSQAAPVAAPTLSLTGAAQAGTQATEET